MTRKDCEQVFEITVFAGKEELRLTEELSITIDDFLTRFGDTDMNYEALMQHPNTTQGWSQIWSRLRDEGKLL